MKDRKKPVVIEAFQMTQEQRWDNSEWPNWLHEAWQKDVEEVGSLFSAPDGQLEGEDDPLFIHTLEGNHKVLWGDYIIQGVHGELYPCKPDIFEKTYERIEE